MEGIEEPAEFCMAMEDSLFELLNPSPTPSDFPPPLPLPPVEDQDRAFASSPCPTVSPPSSSSASSSSSSPCVPSPPPPPFPPASKPSLPLSSSSDVVTVSSAILPVTSEGLSISPPIPSTPDISPVSVQNLIASVHLCVRIDLRSLVISVRNAEYNPRKVNAVVVRYRSPRCTALIFHSGRMMITGAPGDQEAREAAKKIAKLIQIVTKSEGMKFRGFKVENLIALADCGVPVRLEDLAKDHKDFCCYEPELFAGLVYRYNPCSSAVSAVLLVFVSGKIIITGCRKKSEAESVFDSIYPVVMQYQT
eukprot:GHVS01007449.1.p1 GENE.GHVS01007449.1~~GHVS01007449.1.p1  ORF type:complete len:307 (+),score=74.94 GHVS01007449.1:243-1163(+)